MAHFSNRRRSQVFEPVGQQTSEHPGDRLLVLVGPCLLQNRKKIWGL